MLEVIITLLIVIVTILMLYKNIKKKSKGCNCSCCTSKCPSYSSKTSISNVIKDTDNK